MNAVDMNLHGVISMRLECPDGKVRSLPVVMPSYVASHTIRRNNQKIRFKGTVEDGKFIPDDLQLYEEVITSPITVGRRGPAKVQKVRRVDSAVDIIGSVRDELNIHVRPTDDNYFKIKKIGNSFIVNLIFRLPDTGKKTTRYFTSCSTHAEAVKVGTAAIKKVVERLNNIA